MQSQTGGKESSGTISDIKHAKDIENNTSEFYLHSCQVFMSITDHAEISCTFRHCSLTTIINLHSVQVHKNNKNLTSVKLCGSTVGW